MKYITEEKVLCSQILNPMVHITLTLRTTYTLPSLWQSHHIN